MLILFLKVLHLVSYNVSKKIYTLYLYFKLVSVLNYWYSRPTPIKILYIMTYNINVKVKIVLYHFETV